MKNFCPRTGILTKCVYTLIIAFLLSGFSMTEVGGQTGTEYITVPTEFYKNDTQWAQIETELSWNLHRRIVLNWSGQGGYIYMLNSFLSALSDAYSEGKEVQFNVTGYAGSAQAIALCYATNVSYSPGSLILFHATWRNHRGENPKPGTVEWKSQHMFFEDCRKAGFLTEYEINQMESNHMEVILTPQSGRFKHTIMEDK